MTRLFSTRILGPALKVAGSIVVAALLFVLVTNAIKNPAPGQPSDYTARFSDVSGLRPNADVRIRGVRVGKVNSVEYRQDGMRSTAEVGFSVDREWRLTDDAHLAIKYANLSGIRYLDVTGAGGDGPERHSFGTDRTTPSFDITSLFNGLQPTLEALQPEEINQFTENALALVQGDGGGLEPMLKSIDRLASYADDREQVISALVDNLAHLSTVLGGKSPQVIDILRLLESPVDKALEVLDEFEKGDLYGPPLMGTLNRILAGLGIEETADSDAERLFSQAFPTIGSLGSALRLIPTVADGLGQIGAAGTEGAPAADGRCSRGRVELPATVRVLLAGNEVVVCKG